MTSAKSTGTVFPHSYGSHTSQRWIYRQNGVGNYDKQQAAIIGIIWDKFLGNNLE